MSQNLENQERKTEMDAKTNRLRRLLSVREARTMLVIEALASLARGWFYSTYVLFLLGKGLTLFHANFINLAFMVVGFLLDPGTGRIADKVGQRKVYLWGQLAWGLGMAVYGFGNSFWAFLAAECVGAVGHALMSEALESWLRNTVSEDVCHQTISFSKGFAYLAAIPTAILGGVVGSKFGLEWPWRMSFLSSMVCLAISWSLLRKFPKERLEQTTEENSFSVLSVIKLMWKTPPLRFTALVAFGFSAAVQPFNMFWTAVLKQSSGNAWWLGFVWIGIATATFAGSFLAARIKEKGIALASFLTGVPMLIPYLFPKTTTILAGFFSHEVGRGAIVPELFTYSNRFIENQFRSTANSFRSSAWGMGAAFGLALSGVLTFWFSPLQIWGISATALIFLSIYAWRKE